MSACFIRRTAKLGFFVQEDRVRAVPFLAGKLFAISHPFHLLTGARDERIRVDFMPLRILSRPGHLLAQFDVVVARAETVKLMHALQ